MNKYTVTVTETLRYEVRADSPEEAIKELIFDKYANGSYLGKGPVTYAAEQNAEGRTNG